jgi:hypothetical protein
MPDRCCVPCCESNYCSTKEIQGYISVFRFPSNPQLFNKWVKSIPRENWAPSKRSVVCIKHFEPHFILTSYHYQTASGQTQTYSKMLMISLLISLQSKKCYEALRANSILQLPHPKYLQQLTSSLKVSPDKSLQNNHFLKVISSKLSEKWVVLEADKIYVLCL